MKHIIKALADANYTNVELAEIHNKYSDVKVKKFETKMIALNRTAAILEKNNITNFSNLNAKEIKMQDSKKENVVKTADNKSINKPKRIKGSLPGPLSEFKGKRIHKLTEINPRRAGTCGWHSWNIAKEGMLFEDYQEAKGRVVDLRWDVNHDFVEMI